MAKVVFVTYICPHYRVRTFEILAEHHDVDYIFFSTGAEWFWPRQHGTRAGNFRHAYLPGFRLGRTRITPTLAWKLWRGNYDVYLKCINGRAAVPITYLVARLKRKPFVLWTGVWMRLGSRAHRLFFPITRYIYRHSDAVVVYGEHVKRYLVGEGVRPERVFVAPHAVDNEQYCRPVSAEERARLRQELHIRPEQKVVLYLGRFEESKGLTDLLAALAMLKDDDWVLVMAGTGSQSAQLEQVVAASGLDDRVRFPGYIPTDKTTPYYAIAWVYVLPSITVPTGKEPWGLVVNEAFNQGVPVIATDAVGAAAGGLVQDGVNGFIVPERNSRALASALQQVLADDGLRDRLSGNARRIIAGWDNERMVQGFSQAIEYAMGATP